MKKAGKPTIAGILNICGGGVGIGVGIYMNLYNHVIDGMTGLGGLVSLAQLGRFLAAFGGIAIGLGVISLIGGICAIKRRRWGLALAGAITAMPLVPVGTPLGIVSTVLLAKGRHEFQRLP